ncbi:MAG: polymer-forming cytoskeletal protein [Wenzhouxiangellaceae bacterium]|nr:polymer-forming cytoskeletal protein [Wenzhouxiangellaceae bacterium]
MFNKRESSESETSSHATGQPQPAATKNPTPAAPAASAGRAPGQAVIGPTISIDGTLKGEEDLVVEGRVKGTVELKSNILTVGSKGILDAQVYAHTILVEGTVKGDLYASERISIRASARIDGNILAPRISLEDGAKFRGSVDMDPESEALREAFKATSAASTDRERKRNRSEKETGKQDTGGASASSGTGQPHAAEQGSKAGTSAA